MMLPVILSVSIPAITVPGFLPLPTAPILCGLPESWHQTAGIIAGQAHASREHAAANDAPPSAAPGMCASENEWKVPFTVQNILCSLSESAGALQVAFYEIAAGLWVRNGLQIRGQAMTYVQYHFCNSMVDADLFLLQVRNCDFVFRALTSECESNRSPLLWYLYLPAIIVDLCCKTGLGLFPEDCPRKVPPLGCAEFGTKAAAGQILLEQRPGDANAGGCTDLSSHTSECSDAVRCVLLISSLSSEQWIVKGMEINARAEIWLLNSLACLSGMTETELTRMEMVTLLCMADRTHSQLMEMMPERCGFAEQAKGFEAMLKEVAEYRAPNFEVGGGSMQQGMYVPKVSVWERDYDPIYVLLRAMYRRDFQASMDRYTA